MGLTGRTAGAGTTRFPEQVILIEMKGDHKETD